MEMGGLSLERFEGGVCDVVGVLYLRGNVSWIWRVVNGGARL
jgi:hypothetical protein